MSAVVRCLVCLLAVPGAVGRSGASQPQPSAGVGTALEPDQLLRLIVQDVTANIQPLITKLASRIDGLDARLISLDTRLVSLDSRLIPRLNSIEAHLNALDSNQDSFDVKLDSLASRVDSEDNRLDARHDELVSRVDFVNNSLHSTHDELVSRVNSTELRVDSQLDDLTSQLNSTNNSLNSRLNELVTERNDRLASASSRLDGLASRLDELTNLTETRLQPLPRDCSGLPTGSRSGIYLLQPGLDRSRLPVKAYCDMESDGGRWTVIQRRTDIQPRQNFNLSWSEYREGFGDLEAEFWWGLDNIWRLTGPQHRQYELRVNLADFDGGRRHASYRQFRVASEADGYRLTVSNYTGDAGDSLGGHSGDRFSTYDRDQDNYEANCAAKYGGGWWLHSGCYQCNLNGPYLSGEHDKNHGGVHWGQWRRFNYSLKETEMKVRPVDTD